MKAYNEHMLTCPKCGCYNISGPKYVERHHIGRGLNKEEYMEWQCRDCGYSEQTKCKDSK